MGFGVSDDWHTAEPHSRAALIQDQELSHKDVFRIHRRLHPQEAAKDGGGRVTKRVKGELGTGGLKEKKNQ